MSDNLIYQVVLGCLRRSHEAIPVSVIFNYLRGMQYIDPSMFGHRESKKTGIALHNLPLLKPTDSVRAVVQRVHMMGKSATRKRDRSETYPGIAAAMAEQWGVLNDAKQDEKAA